MNNAKSLWEILVPAQSNEGLEFSMDHHHSWDDHVREISGGLTILKTAKGQWVDESGALYRDTMIPVRIACTQPQILEIMKYTLLHYQQKAVMSYRISDLVLVVNQKDVETQH